MIGVFTRALVVAAAGSSAINRKKSPGTFVGDGDFGHLEGNIATVAHHIRADMLRSRVDRAKGPIQLLFSLLRNARPDALRDPRS
jgi:hypothetical protein